MILELVDLNWFNREFELAACGFELETRAFELVTRAFETRNSWV